MVFKEHSVQEPAVQPIGYWSGETYRRVVGAPGTWTRSALTRKLETHDDLGIDFGDVYDDLIARGWMRQDGAVLTLTEEGEAGRLRAKERDLRVHEQTYEGIEADDYAAALNVLTAGRHGGPGRRPQIDQLLLQGPGSDSPCLRPYGWTFIETHGGRLGTSTR